MSSIADKAVQALQNKGYRGKYVSTSHISELREDIDKLHRQGLLDKKFSESSLRFQYNLPEDLLDSSAVFIIAMPQPITRVHFNWHDNTYAVDVPPHYLRRTYESQAKDALQSVLNPADYKLSRARLPLKTLAVRSGLAQYGRNNISYIPGFGSFYRLTAHYTDCPTAGDDWQELKIMKACEKCFKCLENCPTNLNESTDDFPQWVKPEWHNAGVGCMRCQSVCPVNRSQIKKIADGPEFSHKETDMILQNTPLKKLPEATREKLKSVSLDDWYYVFPRNLGLLIEQKHLRLRAL